MEMNNWECYSCGTENEFKNNPTAYLGNYHPLCKNCADNVLYNEKNKNHFRLTYHKTIGDLKMIGNVPVENGYPKLN